MQWRSLLSDLDASRHPGLIAAGRRPGGRAAGAAAGDGFVMRGVSKRFGSVQALEDLSFAVHPGEILGVAGPNGAGKSTMLAVATGHLRPTQGEVAADGRALTGQAPHRFCKAGIARMFQIPQVFASLTVRENVETGAMFGGRPRGATPETVARIIDAVGLGPVAQRPVADADLITRKRVMLGAALATNPRILFMDEPLGGLNEAEIAGFSDLVAEVRSAFGLSIVLVEHKIRALARLSDRIMIMNFGRLVKVDAPRAILTDPEVVDLYLGRPYDA